MQQTQSWITLLCGLGDLDNNQQQHRHIHCQIKVRLPLQRLMVLCCIMTRDCMMKHTVSPNTRHNIQRHGKLLEADGRVACVKKASPYSERRILLARRRKRDELISSSISGQATYCKSLTHTNFHKKLHTLWDLFCHCSCQTQIWQR